MKKEGEKIEEFQRDLRKELDKLGHLIYPNIIGMRKQWGKYLDLDSFWIANDYNRETGEADYTVDESEYWTADGLWKEEGHNISYFTRMPLRYPKINVQFKLPDLSQYSEGSADHYRLIWGQAIGGGTLRSPASFRLDENKDLYAFYRDSRDIDKLTSYGWGLKVTSLLPADAFTDTGRNAPVYKIKVNKGFAEFYINQHLVAVWVNGARDEKLYDDSEPYAVGIRNSQKEPTGPLILELVGDKEVTVSDLRPTVFRVVEGVAHPPRTYKLYDEAASTLLTAGTYDTGTSYKSHPIPTAGYNNKTLLFRADTDSVADGLRIEVFTQEGNWRLYDSVTTSANDLEYYGISANFPLVRIGYEPSADGASITDAEIHLQ